MTVQIPVVEQVLSANDQIALQNRSVFDRYGIAVVNFMASPGAGKTSLVLRSIEGLRGRRRIGVIEGDLASRIDADRVAAAGAPAVQINTGGGCHLDAPQVADALAGLPLAELDLLLIENVGNLVCPTNFLLGEHRRVLVASVPEGDDKPLKYPGSFVTMDAVVLNKIDLLPFVDFDVAAFERGVRAVNQRAPIFLLSCRTGEGLEPWLEWLAAA
ncbi:MAG: hydrogenase nickel incorporation protein HypB [Caldilineales bacterium]|nr:hydrogenase nickel incorporation protein HypB [Caldilineales bacterium]MDW8316978.1 hydrogenase nickel incorporation protein HypB [Anaerolineae bacterium]